MSTEIKIPELGENIESAEVLSVLVKKGEWVEKDQPVIELETDKATAEVPADSSGVVQEILVKEGQTVQVGSPILRLEASGEPAKAAGKSARPGTSNAKPEPEPAEAEDAPEGEAAAKPSSVPAAKPREAKAAAKPSPKPAPSAPLRLVERQTARAVSEETTPAAPETEEPAGSPPEVGEPAPAAPGVRRLARELGIDINQVAGSGTQGRVSEDDIKTFARRLISGTGPRTGSPAEVSASLVPELPDFSAWGEVEREPASKIRRVTAQAMSLSWSVIPHVTQFDRADITELEAWRKRYADRAEAAGGKLTLTAIAVKVLAAALRVHPKFNASYDAHSEEIVYKKYVHVGVAVDTDHGLLVPVIHDADAKNILTISTELSDLAARARTRKIQADELQGANMNLSNLGGLGTTYFSPIVVWPQVAVVGMGRASLDAVARDGGFEPRRILPLSISYDHRIIDGAEAARFLRWMAEAFEEPMLLALEG